jgi:hypothetical protein
MNKWCSLLLFLSLNVFAGDQTLIFVHLGDNVLPCIFTTMKQARYLNQESDIYLLTDPSAYRSFKKKKHQKFLSNERIHLINMDQIPVSQEHQTFRKINKIDTSLFNGFWSFALERFFYLFDFIKDRNLEQVVHLESDTMLYVGLGELLPMFKQLKIRIAAPFQSAVGCIPCFVFIKDSESFAPLMEHITSEMIAYTGPRPHIDVNDMQTLASFFGKFGAASMTPLPILMPEYGQYYSKRTSTFEPDNQTSLDFLSQYAHLFPGYIFDAAALGVFANGNDRRYFPNNGPGIIHYRSLYDPGHFTFFWDQNKKVPYLSFKGKNYRIVNMHFHSKMAEGHTSYRETRDPFATESHP